MTVFGFKGRPRHFFIDQRPRRGRHILAPRDPSDPATVPTLGAAAQDRTMRPQAHSSRPDSALDLHASFTLNHAYTTAPFHYTSSALQRPLYYNVIYASFPGTLLLHLLHYSILSSTAP